VKITGSGFSPAAANVQLSLDGQSNYGLSAFNAAISPTGTISVTLTIGVAGGSLQDIAEEFVNSHFNNHPHARRFQRERTRLRPMTTLVVLQLQDSPLLLQR